MCPTCTSLLPVQIGAMVENDLREGLRTAKTGFANSTDVNNEWDLVQTQVSGPEISDGSRECLHVATVPNV